MVTAAPVAVIEAAVAAVVDPEIRVLTLADLGVLRGVTVEADGHTVVTITPTYTGCPAMDVIRADVRAAATRAGGRDVEVRTVLSPPWTTDRISAEGRAKLAAAGVAPPVRAPATGPVPLTLIHPSDRDRTPADADRSLARSPGRGRAHAQPSGPAGNPSRPLGDRATARVGTRHDPEAPPCPRCGSADTEELSRFGSTACKALWRCRACREPFDHIKDFT